jgi:phosphatidate cytidylyltransferase
MADGKIVSPAVSDLPMRLASAVVMLVVAGGALWLGGWFWTAFVAALAGGVLWEWNRLVRRFGVSGLAETVWFFAGVIYIGAAATAMLAVRNGQQVLPLDPQQSGYGPIEVLVAFILPVVAVDVGAYFAGRAIGGPKIAPRISPSKTWAGLGGGMIGAAAVIIGREAVTYQRAVSQMEGWQMDMLVDQLPRPDWVMLALGGVLIAVIAQAGDFFESWMKRRAGVKDSGTLLPGHGGLFDRLDGFIAVFFVLFVIAMLGALLG